MLAFFSFLAPFWHHTIRNTVIIGDSHLFIIMLTFHFLRPPHAQRLQVPPQPLFVGTEILRASQRTARVRGTTQRSDVLFPAR